MKKALISPIEPRNNGYRVAQVEPADNIFPVGDPLYWADCPDYIVADRYFFNPEINDYERTDIFDGFVPSIDTTTQPQAQGMTDL